MPENETGPVTLASLRGVRGRPRRTAVSGAGRSAHAEPAEETTPPQLGLLFSGPVNAGDTAGDATDSLVPSPLLMPAQRIPALKEQPREQASRGPEKPVHATGAATPAGLAPWGIVPSREEARAGAAHARVQGERRVWTVRAIVADVRGRVEGGYGEVWVEGEISNCRSAASGHLYLSLKDGDAQLPVVLFRRQAQMLRFRAAAGMAVLVRGRLSVYEGRGELQLIGETLEPRGAGALLVAFEQLKARLAAEGLFRAERKRALPPFPKCVGVITSTSGAVLHDIANVVRRRHGRLNLLVYPALVQGPGCAASVISGLRWFNQNRDRVELIVVARGGGSPEDLAGFNDEALARAIAESDLPVISAVGHETDFTIADFVADLRAPTPSAAAEIMTESQHRIEEQVEALERRLKRASRYRVLEARQRFVRMSADHVLRRVQHGLDRRQQRLDELERRMARVLERDRAGRQRRLDLLRERLDRQNVATRLIWGRDRLERMQERLREALAREMAKRLGRVDRMTARLEALSPLAVLARGYALLYKVQGTTGEEGGLITSSTDTAPGRQIRARLAQGTLWAEVTETEHG